jgi:hypothetical protein
MFEFRLVLRDVDFLFGAWPIYFGPVGINLSIIFLGLFVLILAIIQKLRAKRTYLFEISFLLFLVGFVFLTLHGELLQYVFPISLPEKPLVDNNLTFNYALTNLLTYMVFPVLLLILFRSDFSLEKVGLKVLNLKKTVFFAFLGLIFSVFLFLLSYALLGFRWISEYTFDGLVLWILFVTILSVFTQTFFYNGILFNKYLNHENGFLLATISILAFQMFTQTSLPWIVVGTIGSAAKIAVTWKTRNIYGATLMGIILNLIDITIQIL